MTQPRRQRKEASRKAQPTASPSSRPGWYIEAAASVPEVRLTTTGRKSGKRHTVTIWITTDGEHVYVRSGGGMGRDWPQNLMASGAATLSLGGKKVEVKPRHVTDADEARATSQLARKKYGSYVKPSKPGEPLTQGETAVFELIPGGA
jgi:deazaflavin-dependent oxidoreductase (nitroreductase family)